ncbi:hypothetical protein [Cytobacillus praedii]|uniref:hypothetical protein n=1 Tax=Cytobacillus praedii TaxID=1742358 RepID=UPI002E1DD35B|nr:hypothetical protein [Cytobacillus praedii]MED3573105.1 hypothetical protein [Cytobacillus praedii]
MLGMEEVREILELLLKQMVTKQDRRMAIISFAGRVKNVFLSKDENTLCATMARDS